MPTIYFKFENVNITIAGNTILYPEYEPIIYLYLSSDLGSIYSIDREEIGDIVSIREPDLKNSHAIFLPDVKTLTESSCLIFSLYVTSEYDGYPFYSSCGSTVIYIKNDILNGSEKDVYFIEPHIKSDTHMKCSFRILWNYDGWEKITIEPTKSWKAGPHNLELNYKKMTNYGIRNMYMFLNENDEKKFGSVIPLYTAARKMVPKTPNLKYIHCPFFQTDINNIRLPFFAYGWQTSRNPPNEDYFENLIRCSLKIYNMDENDFLNTIEKQSQEHGGYVIPKYNKVLEVLGNACSLYAQGKLYVPDHVNLNLNGKEYNPQLIYEDENMSNLRVTMGNDCEDMGQDIMITVMTIRQYEGWSGNLLIMAQKVLRGFIPLLTHAAVTSASASCITDTNNDELIAHIFCILMPLGKLYKMFERTGTVIPRKKTDEKNVLPLWNSSLEILLCEGTGRTNPILKPEWVYGQRKKEEVLNEIIEREKFEHENNPFASFNIIQKSYISHPKNKEKYDNFYRYIVGATLPRGIFGSFSDVTFVYPSDVNTYGVLIHDLVYDDDTPGLVINEILQEEEILFIDDALRCLFPIPQLKPRDLNKIEDDHLFLGTLGLKEYIHSSEKYNFSYFFDIMCIRQNPSIIEFEGEYRVFYKYIGLDNNTSHIELCFF